MQKQHASRTVLGIGMWVFAPASDMPSCAEAGQPRGHTAVPSVTLGTVFGQLQSYSILSHKTGRVRVHTQLEAKEVFSAAEGRPGWAAMCRRLAVLDTVFSVDDGFIGRNSTVSRGRSVLASGGVRSPCTNIERSLIELK